MGDKSSGYATLVRQQEETPSSLEKTKKSLRIKQG
jgi:hypothetical protein